MDQGVAHTGGRDPVRVSPGVLEEETHMRWHMMVLVSSLMAGPAMAADSAMSHGMAECAMMATPTITVEGMGMVRTAPDEAMVRLGITRQATTARQAQDQTSGVARDILTALTRLRIPRERIQTSQLSLFPVYAEHQDPNAPPAIVGYRASNTVSIRIENLPIIGQVVDAALAAGANQVEGVTFGLRNEAPAREQALRDAVMQARSKAQALAQGLQLRMGPVLEVQETGVAIRPPILYAAERMSGASTPVSPGEVEVSANVTVRFRITGEGP
jgi:hypothetical protein